MTFTACSIPELQHNMSVDLQYLQQWLIANKLTLNIVETEYMLVGSRQKNGYFHTKTTFPWTEFCSGKYVVALKCLSVQIDEFLTWESHIIWYRSHLKV